MNLVANARHKSKYDLAVEVLRSIGKAKLPVTGASMLPSLCPGDILEVHCARAEAIMPGEVVVYRRDGLLVVHRVVERVEREHSTLLITRGDRMKKDDEPVSAEELLGRVIAVERGKRRIDPRLTTYRRMAGWILRRSELSARVLLRFRGMEARRKWPVREPLCLN